MQRQVLKKIISKNEALYVAKKHMKSNLQISRIKKISETDTHQEDLKKFLPTYIVSFEYDDAIKDHVSATDGRFQTVQYRSWRWFDFLWMTHIMDYQGRDDFNSTVVRVFSL